MARRAKGLGTGLARGLTAASMPPEVWDEIYTCSLDFTPLKADLRVTGTII